MQLLQKPGVIAKEPLKFSVRRYPHLKTMPTTSERMNIAQCAKVAAYEDRYHEDSRNPKSTCT